MLLRLARKGPEWPGIVWAGHHREPSTIGPVGRRRVDRFAGRSNGPRHPVGNGGRQRNDRPARGHAPRRGTELGLRSAADRAQHPPAGLLAGGCICLRSRGRVTCRPAAADRLLQNWLWCDRQRRRPIEKFGCVRAARTEWEGLDGAPTFDAVLADLPPALRARFSSGSFAASKDT